MTRLRTRGLLICVVVTALAGALPAGAAARGTHARIAHASSAAQPPGWAVQPTEQPSGAPILLDSVSCTSRTFCMAVGNFFNTSSPFQSLTLAEEWNGSTWSMVPTPNPVDPTRHEAVVNSFLYGVSCTSAQACTAVGSWQGTGAVRTLAERWDGKSWSIQSTPNNPGASTSVLFAVSCPSAAACTAVGQWQNDQRQGLTMAERWNGTSWSIQQTPTPHPVVNPDPPRVGAGLMGVSCPSATSCVAVGTRVNDTPDNVTLAERWNGNAWSVVPTPNSTSPGSFLDAVSCTSSAACMAVGYGGYSNLFGPSLAVRWNGTTWSVEQTPNPQPTGNGLSGVSCSAANACTAVASGGQGQGFSGVTSAARWDGASWSMQNTPNPTDLVSGLAGVSCPSATNCTAVGESLNGALAEHWTP